MKDFLRSPSPQRHACTSLSSSRDNIYNQRYHSENYKKKKKNAMGEHPPSNDNDLLVFLYRCEVRRLASIVILLLPKSRGIVEISRFTGKTKEESERIIVIFYKFCSFKAT